MSASEAEIRDFCVAYLRDSLDIAPDQVVPDAPFARLGLDSASSVMLLVALEDWLDVELDPALIAEYPTIAALARYVASRGAGDASQP